MTDALLGEKSLQPKTSPAQHKSQEKTEKTVDIVKIYQDIKWTIQTYSNRHGSVSKPINTIFRGMTIHLPAILMWTEGG